MPLNPKNTRRFHRRLYAGQLETVTLIKRNPDQQAGTTKSYKLFNCRHSYYYRIGEPHVEDLDTGNNCVWHIPREELDRVGVAYINQLDVIVDKRGRHWQPEANTAGMTMKLWENHIDMACKQVKAGTLTPSN